MFSALVLVMILVLAIVVSHWFFVLLPILLIGALIWHQWATDTEEYKDEFQIYLDELE